MKTIFFFLLCFGPLTEILIDNIDWKKEKTNKHGLTAMLRWITMGLFVFLAYKFVPIQPWRSIPLTLIFHLTFFGPLYNITVLKQHWSYLSEEVWWDRIELWIISKIPAGQAALVGIKLILLTISIGIYIYGEPCYGGGWSCF